ncbi:MAG: FAD binding domain-containing protein [Ferruginibacter sp.]
MISFILNNQTVVTNQPSGSTVLDFVRYHKRLSGTKIGCREGDCGACTILVGDREDGKLIYRSMTSCLMPLGNAQGKHIVTVEGINMADLSPVQQAMVDTNGTQCGFCTIGFVMSLTGFVMNETAKNYQQAIASIDGNICRCTGYKSIERAAEMLSEKMNEKPGETTMDWLISNNFIPAYFNDIANRLQQLKTTAENINDENGTLIIGGGTDLIVQKHSLVKRSATNHVFDTASLKGVRFENEKYIIGASTTVTDFAESILIQNNFPDLAKHIKLVSSTPIRNMATIAGNIVNASPIGDMTVFFLALNAEITLSNHATKRSVLLKDFYKGYKQLDKTKDEFIESISFSLPSAAVFNFEKVCKRTHLDIASVNSACMFQLNNDGTIEDVHLAAGGVAPFPKYLFNTVAFLKNKKISAATLKEGIKIMNEEIAPISDARGTADYKRLLLRQLFLAHFAGINKNVLKEILLQPAF